MSLSRLLLSALALLCLAPLASAQEKAVYPDGVFDQLDVYERARLRGGAIAGNAALGWILDAGDYGLAVGEKAFAVMGGSNRPSLLTLTPSNSGTWWNAANIEGILYFGQGNFAGKLNTDATYDNNGIVFTSEWNNGNPQAAIGIGVGHTFQTGGYLLSVAGKARMEEVVVETGWWADFVFADEYDLRPLSEVRRFIAEHRHLPDMPSAAEVEAEGVALGDMQARLLQKVEELTLYALDQDETIARQARQMEALEARLSALESR